MHYPNVPKELFFNLNKALLPTSCVILPRFNREMVTTMKFDRL